MKKYPLLSRFALFILVPLLGAALYCFVYARATLPQRSETIFFQGMSAPATIAKDEHGIPQVTAATDDDVFFAMGYLHAQDRLWQLEVQRRTAQGRLSEVFGKEALQGDIWIRTLGIYQAAQSSWSGLSQGAQASLVAYANGINAWTRTHDRLPLEFQFFGVKPGTWTPVDSLAWVKIFGLNLSGNMSSEINRHVAAELMTSRQVASLFDAVLEPSATEPKADLAALGRFKQTVDAQLKMGGKFAGSNAMVISGKFTRSGSALMANDPHLSLQIPSIWYAANLKGKRIRSAGMSIVGLPLVVFGRNESIAWGGTSMTADVQDLYVEQQDTTSKRYRGHNRWEPYALRTESIDVKPDFPASLRAPAAPVRFTVRSTDRGPIVSDVSGLLGSPVSLQWTGLSGHDTTYESFFLLNYATNWSEFKQALSIHVAPALNMLFADRAGNIGMLGVGKIPLRLAGNGTVPVPGGAPQYGWRGFIPAAEMPQEYNPARGFIVSANNKNTPEGYPYFISSDWAPPGRAQRITDLLDEAIHKRSRIDVADLQRIQQDTISLPAREMLPVLLATVPNTGKEKEVMAVLARWDGDMARGSAGAAIFNVWIKQLAAELVGRQITRDWSKRAQYDYLTRVVANTSVDVLRDLLLNKSTPWCATGANGSGTPCSAVLHASLAAAVDELTKHFGDDLSAWTWGGEHVAVYAHAPLSKVKLLGALFEGRIATGGSPDTVNVSNLEKLAADGYVQTFGAGFRQIIDFGTPDVTHFYMISTGQSGNILSRHYADMIAPFRDGKYFKLSSPSTRARPEHNKD